MSNTPILVIYWFLFAVALLFAGLGLWQGYRIATSPALQVRVLERSVKVEVREISGKRSRYKAIFAVADLRLERLDTHAVITVTDEHLVPKDDLVSLAFLDAWEPGKQIPVALTGGKPELNPPEPLAVVLGFGVGCWMFGVFAWMARPFAYGEQLTHVGLKFLALGLLPITAAAWGIWSNVRGQKAEEALQRVPVEVNVVAMTVGDFLADLHARGVRTTPEVAPFLGPADSTLSFGEFTWEGKPMRNATVYMSPGMTMRGRLNPANPRDIQWEQ